MNQVIDCIKKRRSCKSFSRQNLREVDLKAILECATYAPSAGNSQDWHFIVISKKEALDELNELIKTVYIYCADEKIHNQPLLSTTDNVEVFRKMALNPNYSFCYHAPVLIIVSGNKNNPSVMADCSCALQNIFLAASSLGVASCWIDQPAWFSDEKIIHDKLLSYSMPENNVVCGCAALGYAKGEFLYLKERKNIQVSLIQ